MTRSEDIIERLRALKPAFRELGLKRVRVFGSVARGEAGPESDVDLLVDFEGYPTLFDVMDIQDKIAQELKAKIDLVTPKALHPALRDRILSEARDV